MRGSAFEDAEVEDGGEGVPIEADLVAFLEIAAADEVLVPFPDEDVALGGGPALEEEVVHGGGVHVPNPKGGPFLGLGGPGLGRAQHRQHVPLDQVGRQQEAAQDPQIALRQRLLYLPGILVQPERRRHPSRPASSSFSFSSALVVLEPSRRPAGRGSAFRRGRRRSAVFPLLHHYIVVIHTSSHNHNIYI
ncbi:B3 domain-containing protein [Senna tora]|uniref:B3 domain-containing protein n=1 Tax=Senna tora TaxID=362788 RepID=A0A835CDT6_9FABA|nr:B3 domain-containing protein [Senna tora]